MEDAFDREVHLHHVFGIEDVLGGDSVRRVTSWTLEKVSQSLIKLSPRKQRQDARESKAA